MEIFLLNFLKFFLFIVHFIMVVVYLLRAQYGSSFKL